MPIESIRRQHPTFSTERKDRLLPEAIPAKTCAMTALRPRAI
jgi:hypothetical protein